LVGKKEVGFKECRIGCCPIMIKGCCKVTLNVISIKPLEATWVVARGSSCSLSFRDGLSVVPMTILELS
jgi:hypothetical protein